MPGKCVFNTIWLNDKQIEEWLAPHERSRTMARCTARESEIDIANNGTVLPQSTVKSHAKEKKTCQVLESKVKGTSKNNW